MTSQVRTAKELGLASCHSCQLLVRLPVHDQHAETFCPRCHSAVHMRKANSISRTWALLIAAVVFYIPANVLPISKVTALGVVQADTIMSGVIFFVQSGSWPIAAVIFIASVFVPVLKIGALMFLVASVQFKSRRRRLDRTRIYRITELVGRWSMVDIFVVSIMAALIHLGAIANFQVGPAAVYFAAVVVLTMIAAMTFDPRLIWDEAE